MNIRQDTAKQYRTVRRLLRGNEPYSPPQTWYQSEEELRMWVSMKHLGYIAFTVLIAWAMYRTIVS